MNIRYLYCISGYFISIQADWNSTTYFYPAIMISVDNVCCLFPTVSTYDDLKYIPRGFFMPPTNELKSALANHNLIHYRPSEQAKLLTSSKPNVPLLELMADELTDMENNGIAFRLV